MEEIRAIRKRISKRLLEAERRTGTFIPELRRMAREADRETREALNGHRGNGKKPAAK